MGSCSKEWLQEVAMVAWDYDKGRKRAEKKTSEWKKKKKRCVLGEMSVPIPREAAEEDGAECRTTAWLFR